MIEFTQSIDIEEGKASEEELRDLQNEIRLLKETLRSQKEVDEKLKDFENEIRLLKKTRSQQEVDEKLEDLEKEIRLLKETLQSQKEADEKLEDFENEIRLLKEILCSQQEVDEGLLIGRDIVKNALKIDSADFPDIAMDMFGYYALAGLTESLGPKFLRAKRRLLIHDQDVISQANVQHFYTNFLCLLLEERFSGFFEQDPKGNFQPAAAFQGADPKTFFPNLVVGSYGFRSKGRIEETFTRCPKEIVEFKQRLLQGRKDDDYESIYNQFGAYMARCIFNDGHLDPPKYLVGILLDFGGAEIFIVETKAVKERKALKRSVIQVSFEWDLKSIEGIARDNQRRDEEIDETSEMSSCKKRTKTSELKADRAEAFYMLFDFILHPFANKHIVERR